MSDALKTVAEFLDVLGQGPQGLEGAIRKWFTPATVWENVGLATAVGADEAVAFNKAMEQAAGIVALRIETLAIVGSGRKVLTERVDDMLDANGNKLMSIRLMGIFEVDEAGKITHWRDYFDTTPFKPGAGPKPEPATT